MDYELLGWDLGLSNNVFIKFDQFRVPSLNLPPGPYGDKDLKSSGWVDMALLVVSKCCFYL